MRAIIMTGGRGVRLQPYTDVLPKGLLPVGGQPILETIVMQLRHYGFTRITMACGYLSRLIQTYFGDGAEYGVTIDYHVEDSPLGTAGALADIEPPLQEPCLLMNCDLLTTLNYRQLYEFHRANNSTLTVASQRKTMPISLGVLEVNQSHVTRFLEKPTHDVRVSMGIYVMDPTVVRYIPKQSFFDVPDLIRALLDHNETVLHFDNQDYWLDIGRPDDYRAADQAFQAHELELLPWSQS